MHGVSKDGRNQSFNKDHLKELENILHNSSTIFFEHDLEGNFLFISPQVTKILGYPPTQLKNKWENIISDHPKNKTSLLNTRRAIDTKLKQSPYEIEVMSKSGEKLWLKVNESPVFENNEVVSIVGEAIDVTEYKKIEDKLNISENKFSKVFQSSPNIIFISNIEDGKFVDINDNGAKKLGFKKSELIGKTSLELGIITSEDREVILNELAVKGQYSNLELVVKTKSGQEKIGLFFGQPIMIGDHNYLFQTITDITDIRKAEEALRKSEERYRKIFNSTSNSMVIFDIELNILDANPAACELYGYSLGEMKSLSMRDIKAPEIVEKHLPTLKKLLDDKAFKEFESIDIRKNGERFFTEVRLHIVNYMGNDYLLDIVNEITERKLSEEALKLSEEKFSKAFYLSPDAIIISRLDNGEIVDLNRGFENIFGYSKEDAYGKTSIELDIYQNISDRDYIINKVKTKGFIRNYETKFRGKNNKSGTCELSSQLIKIGNENYLLTIVRDITERKRAQYDLKISEEKFSKAFFSNQDGMIVTRAADGKIVEINKGIERIFGYSRTEAIGNTTIGLKFWSKLKDRKKVLSIIRKEGRVTNYVAEFNKKNGEKGTVEVSMELIKIEDEDFLITTVKDITERKIIEEEIKEYQKNLKSLTTEITLAEERERRRIAINLHDQLGQSLALTKIKLSEAAKDKEYTSMIEKVSEALKYLDDCIATSRTITYDLSPPVLYELGFAAAIRWKLDKVAEEYKLKVSFEDNTSLSNKLREEVRVLLFRVTSELINNAVKHSGATKLNADIRNDEKNLLFTISDNGKGFDLVNVTKNATKNKSFGLFSIKERISYINGDMIINSAKNKGTKITIKIPY